MPISTIIPPLKEWAFPLIKAVIGDSTQGIGASIEAYALSESEREYADLAASGASLQSTGSIIEAIGAVYLLNDLTEEGLQIQAFGSYAQLAGITLEAIAYTKETLLQVPGTD
ncbi:DUF6944 family repetitive protein [Pseudalkalibacillus sp. R45]|uniref:DUF6944 family repetitive protein n=1 Tax=Pseudalkalibacillus sp. R45 TaxID=3457433 RepID=UPI003FCD900C